MKMLGDVNFLAIFLTFVGSTAAQVVLAYTLWYNKYHNDNAFNSHHEAVPYVMTNSCTHLVDYYIVKYPTRNV